MAGQGVLFLLSKPPHPVAPALEILGTPEALADGEGEMPADMEAVA